MSCMLFHNKRSYALRWLIVLFTLTSTIAFSFDPALEALPDVDAVATKTHTKTLKDWTFISYMAADNDLRGFASRNIKQMSQVGSNSHINIIAHLDIKLNTNQKITRRYYIEKDKVFQVNADDPSSQNMDSGDPKTLISCCKWAIENYPAKHYVLNLWNHGTGILDPVIGRIINPAELFIYNPAIHKLELDRTIGFLDFINTINDSQRGICWDTSTGNYLTNQKLDYALHEICTNYLHGGKFAIIAFDACLMSMLEIANILKKYSHIMAGSQEVELGMGWDYAKALSLFITSSPTPKDFAQHIVLMYASAYGKITNDYTQAAINLDNIELLEKNVSDVGALLFECLKKQKGNSVKTAIKASRNKGLCTHFDEPSYIDLHHFYLNIDANLGNFTLVNQNDDKALKKALKESLTVGRSLIKQLVIANATGKNLSQAQGISIYFPENRIHSSYRKTTFAATNDWATFLTQYLLLS